MSCRTLPSNFLDEAVPIVVLSNSRLAAGVRLPTIVSGRLGVHEGGPMLPLFGVLPGRGVSISAFTRKLLAALFDSLCAIASLEVTCGMWNGVLGSIGSPV